MPKNLVNKKGNKRKVHRNVWEKNADFWQVEQLNLIDAAQTSIMEGSERNPV